MWCWSSRQVVLGQAGITHQHQVQVSIQHSLNFAACSEGPIRSANGSRVVSDRSNPSAILPMCLCCREHAWARVLANGWSVCVFSPPA